LPNLLHVLLPRKYSSFNTKTTVKMRQSAKALHVLLPRNYSNYNRV
jgi:hypothetical protein